MAHNNSNNFGGPIDIPSSSNNNKSTPVFTRRGSLSSSFALATSPGAFASAGNPFLNPISPSSHQTFNTTPPTNLSTSHPTPSSSSSPPSHGILGRRFSVGFNPHPQMVPSSQDNHGSTTATAGGLFRKFSIGGGGGGGGRDRNGTEDLHQPKPQPHSSIFATLQSHQHKDSFEQQHKQDHKTTVQQLKSPENQDKNSRSSSPMRSMILNGQMLD